VLDVIREQHVVPVLSELDYDMYLKVVALHDVVLLMIKWKLDCSDTEAEYILELSTLWGLAVSPPWPSDGLP
jgi:hypothetical protein